jgi:hypothetical protein
MRGIHSPNFFTTRPWPKTLPLVQCNARTHHLIPKINFPQTLSSCARYSRIF